MGNQIYITDPLHVSESSEIPELCIEQMRNNLSEIMRHRSSGIKGIFEEERVLQYGEAGLGRITTTCSEVRSGRTSRIDVKSAEPCKGRNSILVEVEIGRDVRVWILK
jgi:hypothetical protein